MSVIVICVFFMCGKQKKIKIINKMSLGAGALKVEGSIVREGSIVLEVTMATK